MTQERSDLEQRRKELRTALPGLSDSRTNAYRRNSDARALDRAGVKHSTPDEIAGLGNADRAADAAVRDAHRELRQLDAELKLAPRGGLGARFRRAVRRAPAMVEADAADPDGG